MSPQEREGERCQKCGGKRKRPRKVETAPGTPPPGGALVEPVTKQRCRDSFHDPAPVDQEGVGDEEHDFTASRWCHRCAERLRLEQERSLNHKRDQALARAEAAEVRLAEVEKVRDEWRQSKDVGHWQLADRLDRALNETKSQEEGS